MVISNHNSFRVLLDKIASYIFSEKYTGGNYMLALEMTSPVNQHCANCIGTLSFPISSLRAGQLQLSAGERVDLQEDCSRHSAPLFIYTPTV